MFKRPLIIFLFTVLLLLSVSCGKKALPEPVVEGEIEDLAVELVAKLVAEDFSGVESYFDSNMKRQLPAKQLERIWGQLGQQVGSFGRVLGTRTINNDTYDAVLVTSEFEGMVLDIRVVFDRDKRVAGLFFQPAQEYYESGYTPPAYAQPESFTEREVTVGSGEWALPATLTLPREGGPHPAVVLVHGSGPNDRDETIGPNKPFKDLAQGLATRGIAVLRYEKRTREHGQKMTHLLETLTPREEVVDDALAAVALLKNTPEIDPAGIYVLGHSLGGMLAPRIAEGDPDIAGLIILAGVARPLEDVILEQYNYLAALDGEITGEEKAELEKMQLRVDRVKNPALSPQTPAAELPLGMPAPYWLYLRDYSPAGTAKILPVPMLILQGERDYQVTREDFALWQEALGPRPDVRFISYPTLNHLFVRGEGPGNPNEYLQAGNVAKEVIDDISGWLSIIQPFYRQPFGSEDG
jgi:dienelactone hydrolase